MKSVSVENPGQSAGHLLLKMNLKVDTGIWIAAKCTAGPLQAAHTTPIYISIDSTGFYNPKTAQQYLDRCETYLKEIEEAMANPPDNKYHNAWRYKDGLAKRIADTRHIIDGMKKKFQ